MVSFILIFCLTKYADYYEIGNKKKWHFRKCSTRGRCATCKQNDKGKRAKDINVFKKSCRMGQNSIKFYAQEFLPHQSEKNDTEAASACKQTVSEVDPLMSPTTE